MARLPFREDLAGLKPYGAPQLDVPVLLNVNENPFAPSAELVADIARRVSEAAKGLNRYPERDAVELRGALSEYLAEESGVRLPWEQIWAANGSNEIMLHILQAFAGPGRVVASFLPSYSMYPEYARDTFSSWVAGKRNPDFSINLDEVNRVFNDYRPAVVLLASPNNPTGTALDSDELIAILDASQGMGPRIGSEATSPIIVVDEAYGEFRREGVASALELLDRYPNLIVSRTMSKAFGAAGLRLGYMAASREIIDQIMVVRLPYHLSAVTQATALAALDHRSALKQQVQLLREERDQLATDLASLGLDTAPSDANFVMFGTFDNRSAVWQGLLDRGVLIREVGPAGWLRVSVGTPEENQRFMTALKEVLGR
ncbi:MAG: histidinol-phosphate transaminase [Actinomycetaceae bacterium]|nr:histidinol-phosphate transaminase [Actinomycetaceae bacterium]